ncbi:MAG: PAS domain S-box protein [Mariprofundus sp.]|nr:PAS domain S-box protein [Mariprofundus sp.]
MQTNEKIKHFEQQQNIIRSLSLDALSGMGLDELFQKTTTLIADNLKVEYCKILELQADAKRLLLRAGIGWKQGLVGHALVEADTGSQASYTLQCKQPVIMENLHTETRFSAPQLLLDHNIVSGMSIVIEGGAHAWGVLGCHSATCKCFSHDDTRFIQLIANMLALAIKRQQSDDAFRQNQQQHQEALRIAHLGYWQHDADSNTILCSKEARHIFELEPDTEPITYASLLNIIHPEDRDTAQHAYKNALNTQLPHNLTYRLLMQDGRIKWVHEQYESIYNPDDSASKSMAIVQDITERKRAEKRLQLISQFCATASGGAFFPALVSSTAQALDSKIVFVAELLPCDIPTAHTLAICIDQQLVEDIEYPLAGTPCEQIIKGQTLSYAQDLQATFPEDHWLVDVAAESYVGVPMRDDDGRVIGHMGVIDDKPIREQQQIINTLVIFAERAATELKQQRTDALLRKLSQAIEHAGESILITDHNGIIEYINPAFTHISGYSADEAIGQTPRILNSGNQDKAFYQSMWKCITNGNIWQGKVIDKNKDGSFYPAMLTIAPIINTEGVITHYVGTHADLTDLDLMEKQFQQAQKMEAIGTLVGGIAHDFNNMLAGITGNIFLAKKMQDNPDALQNLDNIEQLSFRAADMIKQLLTFARKDRVDIKPLPFTPFIKETLKFLSTSIPENITVEQDICADTLSIQGNATQLHQILMNLINNARDAVEDVAEPCISITLQHFQTDHKFIKKHSYFKAGEYARLSVSDNGCGIPEQQLEHLFEPFFTTKEQGKGTGLGLAMAFGAIKTHHGFIEVESRIGKGSSFHIFIPLFKQVESVPETLPATADIQATGELILLADDEQQLREITAEVLEVMGYRVLQAKDGLEAFEIFKTHQHELDLALLDVVMPLCGGMELAKWIRETSADLPVVFLTGYDKEHVLDDAKLIKNSCILSKPIHFDTLNRIIKEQLG